MSVKTIYGTIHYTTHPELNFATRNNKFSEEKVAFENDDFVIVFDGVILNSVFLFEQLSCSNNTDVIIKLYNQYGAGLVKHIKGAYALAVWDKKQNKVVITNDLLSKRSVYYHIDRAGVCFAGSYFDLLTLLRQANYAPKINISAVEAMSNRGYLPRNTTYLEDVYYLNAFESIVVDLQTNSAEVIRHELNPAPASDNIDVLIDEFDALFTNAVKLQFDKNKAYGYCQASSLSGGMDSRACLLKGINAGYKDNLVCFSYAQSGSLDFQISQQIAVDYHLHYLFYPMDAALFVPLYQKPMSRNECQQRSVGSTAASTVADLLNTDSFGIVHTGLLGGELMGDVIVVADNGKENSLQKVKRTLFAAKIAAGALDSNFAGLIDQLRACQNFVYMFLDHCEVFSPFLDEDVFMFVSQISPNQLYSRKLYMKWMQKYIPNPYLLTHIGCAANASPFKILVTKTFYALQKKMTGKSTRDMNPFDFWFHNNPQYKELFTQDFDVLCKGLSAHENMNAVIETAQASWGDDWLKNTGVLTALHGVKESLLLKDPID